MSFVNFCPILFFFGGRGGGKCFKRLKRALKILCFNEWCLVANEEFSDLQWAIAKSIKLTSNQSISFCFILAMYH